MKLIIQIPCLNEEMALPITLKDLPKSIDGIDVIETLVIDDGSTDRTIEVAQENNVDHILRFTNNKGLAKAFIEGINHSLKMGADIIILGHLSTCYKNLGISADSARHLALWDSRRK